MNFFIDNKINDNYDEIISDEKEKKNIINISNNNERGEEKKNKIEYNWYIEIKSIDLLAPIEETTNMEVLNDYIGHFEDTALEVGNIGLAAHNRGYKNNYFENLKKIKKGDEIKYVYKNFSKKYVVEKIEKIRSTDWSYLEKTKKNIITLITCIENNPELRLCVQATEKD